jgi:TatD DNase family protein
MYPDSHLHLAALDAWQPVDNSPVAASAHSPEEFAVLSEYAARYPGLVYRTFGMHPQNPDTSYAPFLEGLLRNNEIDAIGEAGFDVFTPEYAADSVRQEAAWHLQCRYAAHYRKPLIVHCRKALDRIFRDTALLMKLPVVVFHSFMGSPVEAASLIKRGINAYFSFGKPLLNNNKRAIACVRLLPLSVLLAETDAPYQTLRSETATRVGDIRRVYAEIARIRGESPAEICARITDNFFTVYAGEHQLP